MKNLLRLNVPRKMEAPWATHYPNGSLAFFLAYAGEDSGIRNAMKKAMRTYLGSTFLLSMGLGFQ